MSRVRFNVNTEYAYLQNFKVLQSMCCCLACQPDPLLTDGILDVFARHQIDRPVNVEQLVKCRMQDNLEFLQWAKRFWDQHYPGGEYDALGRRKGSGPPAAAQPRAGATSAGSARRSGSTPTTGTARTRIAAGSSASGSASVSALTQEIATQREAITGLEKERDFYFHKLREIEVLLQQEIDDDPQLTAGDNPFVKRIQDILYSTEVWPLSSLFFFKFSHRLIVADLSAGRI
jgi:RP/EB family microtubule-associated protein